MKKLLISLVTISLSLFMMADVGDCGGSGKSCQSGENCPDGESCDLKTNTCVSTYSN